MTTTPDTPMCGAARDVLPCILDADHGGQFHEDVNGFRWPTAAAMEQAADDLRPSGMAALLAAVAEQLPPDDPAKCARTLAAMTTRTRTFTRAQLDALGLPGDLADESNAAEFPEAAVELHREQVDTRRWVSVHELVFRAPDDGKAYRVTYEQGLTEMQEDHDEWDYRDHVVGEEVEEYDRTVKAWRPVGTAPADEDHPADDEQPRPHPTHAQRLAVLDGTDPLAYVLIRPHATDPDAVDVDARTRGVGPAAVAHVLSFLTDQFDAAARAEDDGLVPYHGEHGYPEGESPAEQRAAAEESAAPRVLTEGEYDRAWHAIEGAAGEPGADPGTVLNAVLRALRIAPSAPEQP